MNHLFQPTCDRCGGDLSKRITRTYDGSAVCESCMNRYGSHGQGCICDACAFRTDRFYRPRALRAA